MWTHIGQIRTYNLGEILNSGSYLKKQNFTEGIRKI